MKQFIRDLAKKLSNYKLLARIMMCISAIVAVIAILGFVAFQFSGGPDEKTGAAICAFGRSKQEREILGMFFFFLLAANLILAIIVLYRSSKFAFPKTKMAPIKSLPILCVVNGGVAVGSAIFCILAVVADKTYASDGVTVLYETVIPTFWYILAVLFFLVAVVHFCMLLPVRKSHYYMPELNESK